MKRHFRTRFKPICVPQPKADLRWYVFDMDKGTKAPMRDRHEALRVCAMLNTTQGRTHGLSFRSSI